ncbi:MAG: multiheme c-type cytochrome [Candidatus Sulfotelmatobacter sp.]
MPDSMNAASTQVSWIPLKWAFVNKMRLATFFVAVFFSSPAWPQAAPPAQPPASPGNEACSSCHAEIYQSYKNTVMARASGPAADGLIEGKFDDDISAVHYRVYQQDGHVWMSYERKGKYPLQGQRQLRYYIGSGVKGRTYVFSVDKFFFEAPINWYAQEHRWNMTPAYADAAEVPLNLPLFPSCLVCHTSGVQLPIAGTENEFSGQPFLHDGITCERCHGSSEAHAKNQGPILNPAKLPPDRRDSICMECHFEGTVAIDQPGKRLAQFQPGDRISDYIHYFVLTSNAPQNPQSLSQFEALSLSECKRKSGDKMWCGSCHDPHSEPSAAEKASYYRGKCLACHGENFAARHHPDKQDCIGCHMPALPSKDVAHTEATDHRIRRYPKNPELILRTPAPKLEIFPASDASLATDRDFALGWQTLAERGMKGAPSQAEQYLKKAAVEYPNDAAVLAALAFVEQQKGHTDQARPLYERALQLDPLDSGAANNLGTLEARAGHLQPAVHLWQQSFEREPYRSIIGMNLSLAFCVDGQVDVARRYLARVLQFDPDSTKAKQLWAHLNADPVQCKP